MPFFHSQAVIGAGKLAEQYCWDLDAFGKKPRIANPNPHNANNFIFSAIT
jgi:hypothetical protein